MATLTRLLRLSPRRLSPRRFFSSTAASSPPNPNPDSKSIIASIDSLYKERNLDRFLSRFKRLSSSSRLFRSKPSIYEVAVLRLSEARRFNDIADILEGYKAHASEFAANEGFSTGIISLYGKAGMADQAYDTFTQLPTLGLPRSIRSFNALLSAFPDPDRVVGEFRSIPSEIPEIVPDVFSYSVVIRSLCEKGDLDSAMDFLRMMEDKGVQPNVVTFNTLLNAFYKNDRYDEAEKVWAKMSEANCVPDVRSFNTKLRWLVSHGKTSEAVELFGEMENRRLKPDGYSFTALIVGYCKDGNFKEAKKAFHEMRERACAPNLWTYEALVPRACEAGELDLAVSLLIEGMKKKCFLPVEIVQEVADLCAKTLRLDEAKALVETGWSRYYSKESLTMPKECVAMMLQRQQEMVQEDDVLKPKVSGITTAVESLYKERDVDKFLSRFKDLSSSPDLFHFKPTVYGVAIRRLCAARRFDDITEILETYKARASEFADDEGFSASLISLYGKASMPDRAYDTFLQLPTLGLPRSVRSFNALLNTFSDADRVISVFQSITSENPEIVPDVFSYSLVIHALCKKGDLNSAMDFLRLMEDKGVQPNVVTFNTLLNGFYKNDQFDEAEKLWAKMDEQNCIPDVRSCNAKLRWLVSHGRTTEAVELFGEMECRGLKPDGYSITALIVGHCKDGNLDEAKKMFDELRNRGCAPNPWTYEALIPQACKAAELGLAVSLCKDSMKKKCYVAGEVFQAVVDELAKASRLYEAKKLVETGWSRHYSKKNLKMPEPCLSVSLERQEKSQEDVMKETTEMDRDGKKGEIMLKEPQQEKPAKGASAKIGIIVKSFEKPKYLGAFGVPLDKNRVKLPSSRTLITVLRSPHIDKKSREQFEMKVRREYMVIKCEPHELHKKYFWFKRARIIGAQFELVFSYKTRLDMSRLQISP